MNRTVKLIVGNVDTYLEGDFPLKAVVKETSYKFKVFVGGKFRVQKVNLFDPTRLSFPSGLVPVVALAIRNEDYLTEIICEEKPPSPRVPELKGVTLRDYQIKGVKRILSRRRGIVEIPTAGGKTIIASASIKAFDVPTVYLVNTSTLLDQTYKVLSRDFPCVGVVGGGKKDWQRITVCMVQTLYSLIKRGDTGMFDQYQAIFIDECHRVSTRSKKATWYQVIRLFVNAFVRVGLSATAFLENEGLLLQASTGPLIIKIPINQLQSLGHISSSRCQFVNFFHDYEPVSTPKGLEEPPKPVYESIYQKYIVWNRYRNKLIAKLAIADAKNGKVVLVFVDQIYHGKNLSKELVNTDLRWVFLSGKDSKATILQQKKRTEDRKLDILIVTRKLFGEGVDIPAVDSLINAAAGKSPLIFVQMFGRGLRNSPGKEELIYRDIRDLRLMYLSRHADERINHCKQLLGQKVEVLNVQKGRK